MATPDQWKDRALLMQIAQALKALGWTQKVAWRDGRSTRFWRKE
jgi:hypothetical protein